MISSESFLFKTSVVISLSIIFILTIILVLPSQAGIQREETGDNPTPDLSFYYTAEDIYRWAESYGESGRESYIRARFTFDIIWPIIYASFLASSIGALLTRSKSNELLVQRLVMLPVFSMVFDFLENISTSIIMWRYPIRTPILDSAATIFTPLKWVLLGASFATLIYAMIRIVYLRIITLV